MLRLIISLLFLSLFGFTFGQKHFKEGFVITNNGDTLFGKIKDRKPEPFGKLYPKIHFKPESGFRKRYSPDEIQAYRCGNTFHKSIWLEEDSRFFKTSLQSAPHFGEKRFVEVIRDGFLSYYRIAYEDEYGISHKYYFKKANNYHLQAVSRGLLGPPRKDLAGFFSDCPELARKILNKEISKAFEMLDFYNENCLEKHNN
jgi:hypothetical protein